MGMALADKIRQESRKSLDTDIRYAMSRLSDKLGSLVRRKEHVFSGMLGDSDDHGIENPGSPAGNIEMATGDRIETPGIDRKMFVHASSRCGEHPRSMTNFVIGLRVFNKKNAILSLSLPMMGSAEHHLEAGMPKSRYETEIEKKGLYLVAEAGSNHNGSLREAKRLVSLAAEAGADAVKFQLFAAETLVQPEILGKMLNLGAGWTGGMKKLEFKLAWLPVLKRLADRAAIDFLCTPFDEERLDALLAVQPPAIKIASGDITHHALIKKAAESGLPVILSTGASNEEEIRAAISLCDRSKTALLQCVMSYPARSSAYHSDVLAMLARYAPVTGISDHTEGGLVAARAVEAGAVIVERHFTRNRRQHGADHAMSTEPEELKRLRTLLLEAMRMRFEGPTAPGDDRERIYARRGMYCRMPIAPGEDFSPTNCFALRPADPGALSASDALRLYGRSSKKTYQPGDPIVPGELEP